jgi:hypothetical protein
MAGCLIWFLEEIGCFVVAIGIAGGRDADAQTGASDPLCGADTCALASSIALLCASGVGRAEAEDDGSASYGQPVSFHAADALIPR